MFFKQNSSSWSWTFFKSCDYVVSKNRTFGLKEKHNYFGQVQLGMALLALTKTYFIIYSPSSKGFLEIVVEFDEIFAVNLITKISEKYLKLFKVIHDYCNKRILLVFLLFVFKVIENQIVSQKVVSSYNSLVYLICSKFYY